MRFQFNDERASSEIFRTVFRFYYKNNEKTVKFPFSNLENGQRFLTRRFALKIIKEILRMVRFTLFL